MEKQEHRTKLNGRVRIKDTVTHMYPNARVYNEGFVRKQIHDELGYPLIFVEWDKDHWAYSGEEDRILLEAHFDPVEEKMADSPHDGGPDSELAGKLIEFLQSYTKDKIEEAEDPRPIEEPEYDDVLDTAVNDARKGEAFIIIVAAPESYQGTELIVPHVYVQNRHEDAALILEATAADYVSQSTSRMIQEQIRSNHDGSSGS